MADTQETTADIVAEMRHGFDQSWHDIDREWAYGLADRLEVALKREREVAEADALTVGGIVEAERHTPGNAAAMREALVLAIEVGDWCCTGTDDPLECCEYSCIYQVEPHGEAGADCPWRKIRAALAAPPRNCDVYKTSEKSIRMFESYIRESGKLGFINPFTEVVNWLLAPATERKGENDGK